MAQARYGIPVMSSLHDIEVPKHLGLYTDHGVETITIRTLNSRMIYMARLEADSPPTDAQLRKRRNIMAAFAAHRECPDCQVRITLDSDSEPCCTNCGAILYPPPSAYLASLAGSYMDAKRDIASRPVWSSKLTKVFLAHHAAELYLKALGACSVFTKDGQEEYLYGKAFDYNQHRLEPLLTRACPSVKTRLDAYRTSDGRSALDLVRAIPEKTSELFRYGVLLKDPVRREVRTTVDGDVVVETTNLSVLLDGLCDLLETFTDAQLGTLHCTD